MSQKSNFWVNYLNIEQFLSEVGKTQFFYYIIEPKIKEGKEFNLLDAFKQINEEKQANNTHYVSIEDYRVCIVLGEEILKEKEEYYIFGKFIASEGSKWYREELDGDLSELELSEERSRLCSLRKGALLFLLYINNNTNKNVLMFEDISFSLGIGGLRKYFNNKYSDILESFVTKQKWGKDLKPVLRNIGNSGLKMAHLKIRRNIQQDQLKYKGVIEKAAPLLLQPDIECELTLRFKKDNKTLKQFLTEIFQTEDITDIFDMELSEVFKNLDFELNNTAEPKFSFFDKVFKFELPFNKFEKVDEKTIFSTMLNHFQDNKTNILEQE